MAVLVTSVGVLVSGCATAKVGTGIPDGAEAAEYVSAKFSNTLTTLSNDMTGNEPRKSRLDWFGRIDDKDASVNVTAVQLGSPPSRFVDESTNDESGLPLDYFHPAGSSVRYVRLGPQTRSLAPTPWVSMPYTGHNLGACFWVGYGRVCSMLNAVAAAAEHGNAAKQAASLPDGSTELQAEVTLRDFFDNEAIPFPDDLVNTLPEEMKNETLGTRIVLTPQGELELIEMNGLVKASGHEVEIRMRYEVLEPPTERDLPQVPDESQVTPLPDEAAVDDFWKRLGEL